jgi:hypothetical protein
MELPTLPTRTARSPLGRGIHLVLELAWLLGLVLVPTVFGTLHRYGNFDLLLVVCLLLALWVVSSLIGVSLRHVRSIANLCLWGVLGFILWQAMPLPEAGVIGQSPAALGPVREVLVNAGYDRTWRFQPILPVARYSLEPAATVGVLLLLVSAAGLYWFISAAVVGRKGLRRAMSAAMIGLALLSLWVLASGLRSATPSVEGVAGAVSVIPDFGGDSLVPALLAALALGTALVLRPLGWMPRRTVRRRQSRFGWLGRRTAVRSAIALAATSLAAVALGTCNVPRTLMLGCALSSIGFVLVGYLSVVRREDRRRAAVLAAAVAVWLAAMVGLGGCLGGDRPSASNPRARLEALLASVPDRALLGTGAGTISPAATFGAPSRPAVPGADHDADGYQILGVEVGVVGLALVLAGVAAFAIDMLRTWRRARSPWTWLAPLVGLGVVTSNLVYFESDAAALLAPNLLAVAGVLGLTVAWGAHGADWRPQRLRELAPAHWPFVVGAVGLTVILGLAEQEMFASAGVRISDKIMHFGTFAVISLLLCYALGPQPATRHLKTRILLAVVGTALLGMAVEWGQPFFAGSRSFEWLDIAANVSGAGLMGLMWWVFRTSQVRERVLS